MLTRPDDITNAHKPTLARHRGFQGQGILRLRRVVGGQPGPPRTRGAALLAPSALPGMGYRQRSSCSCARAGTIMRQKGQPAGTSLIYP